MDISRRHFGQTLMGLVAGFPVVMAMEGCSASTADDITLVIGAAEGVLDIVLHFIPGGSALVGVANAIANDLSQVTTIWGSSATTASKWTQMLAILETVPGQILTLSSAEQAIIAGVGAAVNVIINVIKQLQGTSATSAAISHTASTAVYPAPNAKGVSALLAAIAATRAKLRKL